MKYARKVDLSLDFATKIRIGNWVARFSRIFNSFNVNNIDEMTALLPQSLQNKKVSFYMSRVNFNGEVKEGPPHIHLLDSCVINFYLKTNGEETIFYEGKEVEVNDSTAYHRVLSLNHLQKAESFVAKDNEAWLLKTNQPHALVSKEKKGTRKMLQIYFDGADYDEIVRLLESKDGGS
jgi:hypothetical protein